MFITYEVWRMDEANIEYHGKPTMVKEHLCFFHAVQASLDHEDVKSLITVEQFDCDDCAS